MATALLAGCNHCRLRNVKLIRGFREQMRLALAFEPPERAEYFRRAIKAFDAWSWQLGGFDTDLLFTLHMLAREKMRDGKIAEAEELFNRALNLADVCVACAHKYQNFNMDAQYVFEWGFVSHAWDNAFATYASREDGTEISFNAGLACIYDDYAALLDSTRRHTEALPYYQKALDLREHDPELTSTRTWSDLRKQYLVAEEYVKLGNLNKAEQFYKAVIPACRREQEALCAALSSYAGRLSSLSRENDAATVESEIKRIQSGMVPVLNEESSWRNAGGRDGSRGPTRPRLELAEAINKYSSFQKASDKLERDFHYLRALMFYEKAMDNFESALQGYADLLKSKSQDNSNILARIKNLKSSHSDQYRAEAECFALHYQKAVEYWEKAARANPNLKSFEYSEKYLYNRRYENFDAQNALGRANAYFGLAHAYEEIGKHALAARYNNEGTAFLN